jgi:cystathionine beta-lyase
MSEQGKKTSTQLIKAGRPASGWVNTAVVRGSTYQFESIQAWRSARQRREHERVLSYGARGNETVFALEDSITELEGGYRSKLFPTGLAAASITLLALLRAGDHLVLSDATYEPVKKFCREHLARYGVEHSLFSAIKNDWDQYLRPNTRVLYIESPGSLLYDMCDIEPMAQVCNERGIVLCADNTWGSGVSYRPLELGAHVSIVAGTKYLGGHSDLMLGSVTTTQAVFPSLEQASINLGQTVDPDTAFLALRGMRTLKLRMDKHAESALALARWLSVQPQVAGVFHPAWEGDVNHARWKRDAHGSNGLLSIELQPNVDPSVVERAIDQMQHFHIGASWGGFESLILPIEAARVRPIRELGETGYLLRFHIGLEDPEDLKQDLTDFLSALA